MQPVQFVLEVLVAAASLAGYVFWFNQRVHCLPFELSRLERGLEPSLVHAVVRPPAPGERLFAAPGAPVCLPQATNFLDEGEGLLFQSNNAADKRLFAVRLEPDEVLTLPRGWWVTSARGASPPGRSTPA